MYTLTINGKELKMSKKVKIIDLLEHKDYSILACKVNNRIRELSFEVYYDATIEFLDIKDYEANKLYEASIRYLFARAAHRLYPELNIKFSYNISKAILCEIVNDNKKFNQDMLENIDNEMRRLIKEDIPLERKIVEKEEAEKIYKDFNTIDKIEMLQYRPEKTVHLYNCDGYLDYVYSYMVPSTGYLSEYKLRLYSPGIILQYPRADEGGNIPEFIDAPTYGDTLKRANRWAKICNARDIAGINSHMKDNASLVDFVNMCEARHNDRLALLANKIEENINNIKVIAIAGPSSSGKTTFSNRLRIQLMIRGINPIKISIDDYYRDRSTLKPREDGSYDFEHINAIDTELFNKHLIALINGEEVQLPSFNFITGKREPGKKIRLNERSPIIIEGIHALNEALTISIPRTQKFKIYIAPHVQLNIDNHSPVSSTNIRLIRRIVRDNKFRGFDAERTISVWKSVREGEFKWIYDNQEDVDFVFNSDLVYELCVLKKHALPLLQKIDKNSPYFIAANGLIKVLKYFVDIDDKLVPCNSLLREFIGDSCFQNV